MTGSHFSRQYFVARGKMRGLVMTELALLF